MLHKLERGKTQKKRFLLVCFDNLGDLVFCSALMDPLKKQYPNAEFDLWCKQYTKKVGLRFPFMNEVFSSDPPWDKSPGRASGSWLKFVKELIKVRASSYDAVLVCSPHWKSSVVSWFLKSSMRIGFNSKRAKYFLTHPNAPIDRSKPICSELSRLLTPLNIPYCDNAARLIKKQPSRDSERTVVIHPFAGNPKRCVPLDLWLEIASQLAKGGLKVKIVGSPSELSLIGQEEDLPSNIVKDTLLFPDSATLFCGHDSGPTHVASALGVPIFAVYFDSAKAKENLPQGGSNNHIYRTDGKSYHQIVEKCLEFIKELTSCNH